MKTLRTEVENGKVTGDAPAGLPDSDVELARAEPEEGMSDEDLLPLEAALALGLESLHAGRTRDASEFAAELLRGR